MSEKLRRILDIADRSTPRRLWVAAISVVVVVWLVPPLLQGIPTYTLDWTIYGEARDLWLRVGSPYWVPAPGWDPGVVYPYVYPPTSWPLLLATILPAAVLAVGLVPFFIRPPRIAFAPVALALFAVALGDGLYLGNVNVLISGLLILAFVPRGAGGVAYALVIATKVYPLVLLPFLWRDPVRMRWFGVVLGALVISGTLLLGPNAWSDFLVTMAREGPSSVPTLNPLQDLGTARIVAGASIAAFGLLCGSPTISLVGATWMSPNVSAHYLLTFAAALCVEPPLRGRALPIRSLWRAVRPTGGRPSTR